MATTSILRPFVFAAAIALCASSVLASTVVPQTALPGKNVPKYVDPVPTFVGARVSGSTLSVSMQEFQQKVLPASVYSTLPAPFSAGTFVWGYNVNSLGPSWPARTIVARRSVPTTATYTNNLVGPKGAPPVLQKYFTVDQTLHWADPLKLGCEFLSPSAQVGAGCFEPFTGPVPAAVHLHGAEVPSAFDGAPESWFTPNGLHGAGYATLSGAKANQATYRYPNGQEATTLWFHDHALGSTRVNVFSGLAGFYFLRDDRDTGLATNSINLPSGAQEIELLIQDRQFDTNGQLLFPDGNPSGLNGPPTNPSVHPFWIPEFFGDVMVVNGKSWPFMNVEPRRYRLRLLNGSNARMFDLTFKDGFGGATIWQIGSDGGFLDAPAAIPYPNGLFLAPAERADVIVDFSAFAGRTITLMNDAKAPFPSGASPDPQTVAQIMQFRVSSKSVTDTTCNPASTRNHCNLRPAPIVRLASGGGLASGVRVDQKRQLVLKEIEGPGGPLEVMLNNSKWSGFKESTMMDANPTPLADSKKVVDTFATELPRVGSTEVWEIINTTADAHPIHVHLVQFQVISRQPFQSIAYTADWEGAFAGGFKPGDGPPFPYNTVNTDGAIGGNLAISPYLQGSPAPPAANEAGWKDTAVMKPGEVTRIIARWAPQDIPVSDVTAGMNRYVFDPTALIGTVDFAGNPGGPGYVWHCHILDHEDNEMMRPYAVQP